MTSSAQLERETEKTREQLADTLAELKARVTPGQVVDHVMDYARNTNSAEFFRNLRNEAVRNPMPLALLGMGAAWLMLSNSVTRGTRQTSDEIAGRARQTA